MKERPIIFSTEMVRAILDGRKTQTRRVIKPQPNADNCLQSSDSYEWKFTETVLNGVSFAKSKWIKCPYGQPGDLLWVRETHAYIWPGEDPVPIEECNIEYKADTGDLYPGEWPAEEARGNLEAPKWQPSIHMPKSAARLWLRVTDVRVERVQDITVKDIKDEGIGNIVGIPEWDSAEWEKAYTTRFAELWDSINAKRGYPWESNPWVWVVTFKKIKPGESE